MEWLKRAMGTKKKKSLPKRRVDSRRVPSPVSGLVKSAAIYEAFSRRNDVWQNQITGSNIWGRDKQAGFEFRAAPYFNQFMLDQMYRGDAITQKIMEIYPREALRKGFKISADEDKIIEDVMESLQFGAKIADAAMWARLYGGAAMMLGVADGRKSSEPVDFNNIQRIDYIQVYDRYQAYSNDGAYENDLMSPNYGNPVIYTVTDPMTAIQYLVHSDRILRVDGVTPSPRLRRANNGWGESLLVSCYTYIRDYCAGISNVSTIFNDMVKTVLKSPDFINNLATNYDDVQARISSLAISSANNNLLVIDGNEEFERHSVTMAGYPELFDRLALGLAAVVQIPAGMLFGIEPNGLNASGDYSTRNMYDSISAYQKRKLEPPIRQLASMIMMAKEYNFGVIPDRWSVEFTPLEQMSELESAKIRRDIAEADRIYIEAGVLTPAEVAISRFGGDEYSMDTTIDKALHESDKFANEIAHEQALEVNQEMETVGADDV